MVSHRCVHQLFLLIHTTSRAIFSLTRVGARFNKRSPAPLPSAASPISSLPMPPTPATLSLQPFSLGARFASEYVGSLALYVLAIGGVFNVSEARPNPSRGSGGLMPFGFSGLIMLFSIVSCPNYPAGAAATHQGVRSRGECDPLRCLVPGVFLAFLSPLHAPMCSEGMGLLAIALGVGFGVGFPTAVLYRVSCYFNPAVLLADTVRGKLGAGEFWALFAAELLGHFTGEEAGRAGLGGSVPPRLHAATVQ